MWQTAFPDMHMPYFFQDMNHSRAVIHPALLHAQEMWECALNVSTRGSKGQPSLGSSHGVAVSHDSEAEQSTAQLQPFSHQMGLMSWSETSSTNTQENTVQLLLPSAGLQAHNSRQAPALTVQGLTAAGKPPDSLWALNLKECYSPKRLDKSLTSKGKQDPGPCLECLLQTVHQMHAHLLKLSLKGPVISFPVLCPRLLAIPLPQSTHVCLHFPSAISGT